MTESFRSIWEIKEAIKSEKLRTENISNSAKQWRLIGEKITSDSSNMTSSGHEWQIRYDCQHLYNGMLAKQIKRIRAELRMLRYGADLEMDTMDQRTIGELRTYIKHLQVEKWSLKSLKRMYERQIDAESMDYFRARDQLTQLIKDVKNCRQAWIRAQEKIDQEKLSFLEPPAKKTNLKPVAKIIPIISAMSRKNGGASYSQIFQERSGNISQRVFGRKFYCGMRDTVLITDYTQGEIKTRHHEGGFYANDLMCSWVIDAGDNRRVKLDVNLADLQWSPQYTTCSGYDNLQIIEGDSIEGKSIASVCGARNPYSVVSKGRYLFLQFSSTHQNFGNHKGVEVTFHTFDNQTCAPGWYQQPGDANSCLMIGSTGTASWTDSQDICTYSQSNLVSISNETEYQSIIEHGKNLSLSSAWIGLSDVQSEGKFKWVDTSSYPFVRSLSGNDFRKHCVSIDFNTDKWTVHECERTLLNYICKAKRDGSTVIYSADPASGPPIEVDESNNKTFLIVILVIGGVVFIVGLTLFVCCCVLKRNDRPCCKSRAESHQSTVEYSTVNQTNPDVAPPPYSDVVK